MRRGAVVLLAAAMATTLLACGDDSGSGSASANGSASATATGSGTTPEEHRATDAEVAAGLADLDGIVQAVAAAVADGSDEAETLNDEIEATWQPIEGTILANDEDAYLTFEDNFALIGNAIEDDDADGAQEAADAVSQAADDYLAAFPG